MAASTTLPPALSTSTPARVARGWHEETMPRRAIGAWRCAYPIWIISAPREESRDLVLRKHRQGARAPTLHEGHPLAPLRHRADRGARNAGVPARRSHALGVRRRDREQQRPGRDGAERVEA